MINYSEAAQRFAAELILNHDGDTYEALCSAAELLLKAKCEPQQLLNKAHVLNSRADVIYECQSVLLKQLHDMTHVNGYPSEAVPKATILSLPQLMGVPKRPIV